MKKYLVIGLYFLLVESYFNFFELRVLRGFLLGFYDKGLEKL